MDLDLDYIRSRLFQAAADDTLWSSVLADVNRAAGAAGTCLICLDDRFREMPCSPDWSHTIDDYRRGGWYLRDERRRGIPVMLEHGVMSEFDFTTPDEMRRSEYYEDLLARHKLRWFAGVGFKAGGDLWCLSMQHRIDQGPFERHELQQLRGLWRPFGDAATLSRLLANRQATSFIDGLDLVGHGAIVCDARGRIASVNEAARALLGPCVGAIGGTLNLHDAVSRTRYEALIRDALTPDRPSAAAIPLQTTTTGPRRASLLVRALPIPLGSGEFFLGARILLLFKPIAPSPEDELALRYGLTPAEIEIAKAIAEGQAVADIGAMRGVSENTVRTQLKRVFSKTGTGRQSELVLLVTRLSGDASRPTGVPS